MVNKEGKSRYEAPKTIVRDLMLELSIASPIKSSNNGVNSNSWDPLQTEDDIF